VSAETDRVIQLGEITGAHGVKGWVRVQSFTDPKSNLLGYGTWLLDRGGEWQSVAVEAARESGRRLIAKLANIEDRDAAAGLAGTAIGVRRSSMPAPAPNEYYWADLEGLAVRNLGGHVLGTVDRLVATGANDVLVLAGDDQKMIPFESAIVRSVDFGTGEIIVDWDPGYWE
jgi:16S rRNA processing protein RimM